MHRAWVARRRVVSIYHEVSSSPSMTFLSAATVPSSITSPCCKCIRYPWERYSLYTESHKKSEENNRCPVRYRLAGRIKDIKIVNVAARVNNKKPLRVDRSPICASPRRNIRPCQSEIPPTSRRSQRVSRAPRAACFLVTTSEPLWYPTGMCYPVCSSCTSAQATMHLPCL